MVLAIPFDKARHAFVDAGDWREAVVALEEKVVIAAVARSLNLATASGSSLPKWDRHRVDSQESPSERQCGGTVTTDLKYLALTAILTASLWIPYIVAQVIANGLLTPPNYIDPAPRPVRAG